MTPSAPCPHACCRRAQAVVDFLTRKSARVSAAGFPLDRLALIVSIDQRATIHEQDVYEACCRLRFRVEHRDSGSPFAYVAWLGR